MSEASASVVQIRPDVLSFPKIVTPLPPEGDNPIFLAANEPPDSPSGKVLQAAAQALQSVNRYPDIACTQLVKKIADHHGLLSEQIAVGAGSSSLLIHALNTVAHPGAKALFAWRSFEAYPFVTQVVGLRPQMVPLTDEGGHDLEAMAAAIGDDTAAVIVCNPNNPTGHCLSAAQISGFLDEVPQRVLVIVDEAYIHYVDDPAATSVVDLVERYPNLLVARTFSKAFALAGLRVGYMIGQAPLIAAVRSVSTPFGIAQASQAAAVAALSDLESMEERVNRTVTDRDSVLARLQQMGFTVVASKTNFVWLPAEQLPGSSMEVAASFARAGIAVRPFPEGVRITIGRGEDNDRVLAVLRQLAPPVS